MARLAGFARFSGRGSDSGPGAAASADLAPPRNAWAVRVNATPAAATAAARIAWPAMSLTVSMPDFAARPTLFLAFAVALFFAMGVSVLFPAVQRTLLPISTMAPGFRDKLWQKN